MTASNTLYLRILHHFTMRRLLCICFIGLFIDNVSLQKVEGFVGSSATLPCVYNKQLPDLTIYWRYNDFKNVYDIQEGTGSTKEQHPDYKSRTRTFSHEFVKGDYSLKLEKLRPSDAGTYCCNIPEQSYQQCTELKVKERPSETRNAERNTERNQGADMKASRIVTLLLPLIFININLYI